MGVRVPNEAMSRGTAYHKLIEFGASKYWNQSEGVYIVPEPEMNINWKFSPNAAKPAIDVFDKMLIASKEVWTTANFGNVSGFEVLVRMRYDALFGTQVHEFKTKSRKPTYGEYFESMQWKCYLMGLPGLETVVYHIFQLDKNNKNCTYTDFEIPRYNDLELDVLRLCSELISWAKHNPEYMDKLEERAQVRKK